MEYFICSLILFFIPLYNFIQTKTIRNRDSDRSKENGYIQIYIVYWTTLLLLLFLTYPFIDSFKAVAADISIPTWGLIIIWIMVAYILLTSFLPLLLLPFNQSFRDSVRANYDDRLYPVSRKQQLMFIFVAITVGICEEVMYRGFLNRFVIEIFELPGIWSAVIIAVIFGISHFMQGVRGVMNSFFFSIIMSYLMIQSGSLLLPIIVHILYDLKPIWIVRAISTHKKKAS